MEKGEMKGKGKGKELGSPTCKIMYHIYTFAFSLILLISHYALLNIRMKISPFIFQKARANGQ